MELAVLAQALTDDEKTNLYQYKTSEAFRLFHKTVVYLYSLEASGLSSCRQEELPVRQGRLQGLLMARNLLAFATVPEEPKKSR